MNLEANVSSPEVDIDVNVVSSPEPSPRPLESPQGHAGVASDDEQRSRTEPVSKKGLGVITPVASLPLSAAAAAAAAAASVSHGAGVGLGANGTPNSQDAAMLSR
ncbi:AGAP000488-PA-like protein [Anopheles sinensis]|uniref:AGAP000488-PA-like protein n=1 Tax=Anopheles sinensis TaxID=74873 RepID=A0A084VQB4_ANOSI|nr:AGAP000488-PA-like protein [Anopheles sinensis]